MVIPEWFYATSIIAAFGGGFAVGKYFGPKTVTPDKSFCSTPLDHGKRAGIHITKVYTDGRCSDVSCGYLGARSVCELTETKCKYLL